MTACGGVGDQVPKCLTHSLAVQPHIGRWLQLGPFLRFDPNMDIDDVVQAKERLRPDGRLLPLATRLSK